MENNIYQTVFESLKADTAALEDTKKELHAIDAKIKEGYFGQTALEKEIYPLRDQLVYKLRSGSESAIRKARNLVEQYREEMKKLDDLNPAEITDDIKLLNSRIPLKESDINAIIDRNPENRTMVQLALRYAEDHNIDMHGMHYLGANYAKAVARDADGVINVYERWINKDNALSMLHKFFQVSEE